MLSVSRSTDTCYIWTYKNTYCLSLPESKLMASPSLSYTSPDELSGEFMTLCTYLALSVEETTNTNKKNMDLKIQNSNTNTHCKNNADL